MKDRNVQYPTRFHVKPVPGTDDICEIIPAPGEVYENGTFWNKANVLKDVTAALYGLTADAVPDEVFAMIRPLIAAAQSTASGKANVVFGTFIGTGTCGKSHVSSLAFPFPPEMVAVLVGPSPGASDVNYKRLYIGYSSISPVISMAALTTEFQIYLGLKGYTPQTSGTFGKKSADGKILYWYSEDSVQEQMNLSGGTYYYIAIG